MQVERLAIPEVIKITPARYADNRGLFAETFNEARAAEAGLDLRFVQDNQSISTKRGTVRGLHCQLAPNVQGKLVRCTKGAIWDVAIDIRRGSPNFGKWVSAELTAENWAQLWVPPGFLHGFVTLVDDTEVQYKCTAPYDREAERGVRWNSRFLKIDWPVAESEAVLSEKDTRVQEFTGDEDWFHY